MRETDNRDNGKPREKRRRRKRSMKDKDRSKDADADGEGELDKEEGGEDGGQEDEKDDGRVLGVFVHHSDYLPIGEQNLLHPNVKVHVY